MKVHLLVAASLFMAMFAAFPRSASAAPAGLIISETTSLQANTATYPYAHGTATYKSRAGGGASFQATVKGITALRGQQLTVKVFDINDTYVPVCTIRVNAYGTGSCYVDSRFGAVVPVIQTSTDGSGSDIYVELPSFGDFMHGKF